MFVWILYAAAIIAAVHLVSFVWIFVFVHKMCTRKIVSDVSACLHLVQRSTKARGALLEPPSEALSMSLRPRASNLQNVQNREVLDRFDPDFADVSDTEIPCLAALIASLAVNIVLTALLLRSCLQKSRSFSNGALAYLGLQCFCFCCPRLRVLLKRFKIFDVQIWRILASGYLAMA